MRSSRDEMPHGCLNHRAQDRGATAVEYSFLVALIAGLIVAIVTTLGLDVVDLFTSVSF